MTQPHDLDDDALKRIIRQTPLVSIDLIIRDAERKVLVGLRNNEPAKGYYFVPGGRIRKGEAIRDAFNRIIAREIGCRTDFSRARPLGAYEHLYANNRFGDSGYGTHYIALAYEVQFASRPAIVPDAQHSDFRWMDESELRASARVHDYTKAYFLDARPPAG
jgi:GDP-mannose mannosyl hydrolase